MHARKNSAVLLLDLQTDFLSEHGRMPVERGQAQLLIHAANAILAGETLTGALPVAILNQFPVSAWMANLFRRFAAVAGSEGAKPDPRIVFPEGLAVFAKQRPSAFSNPDLSPYLKARQIERLYVLGVFAEGCVRATVLDAISLGFEVFVMRNAIATNAPWKLHFALSSMERAGASLLTLDGC